MEGRRKMKVSCAYNRLFTVDQTDQILVMDFLEYGFFILLFVSASTGEEYIHIPVLISLAHQNQTMGQAKRRI
jgi:hypothetical protein